MVLWARQCLRSVAAARPCGLALAGCHAAGRFGSRQLAAANDLPLLCAATTNVGKLAGALAARMQDNGHAVIEAAGPAAMSQGVKAIIMAKGFVQERGDRPGETLAVVPEKRRNEEGRTFALQVYWAPAVDKSKGVMLKCSALTDNLGLAKAVMMKLRDAPQTQISCMGSVSLSTVLKASLIARKLMVERNLLGRSDFLALVPRTEKLMNEDKEEATHMILTCIKAYQ
uniref:Uncharacterized protein n=1 Tax=Strombidinopsis acuminata TaxID=141414 RepID=A0A7S3T8Q8_9SPIT|mmetsp:Transcript_58400/g.80175  ORF Transcript_58400/g.80175 Transcript_58400/m.80175 type:complete len:228 (+) Transcript_58400:44-727(+)